jgi:hypothetical protein
MTLSRGRGGPARLPVLAIAPSWTRPSARCTGWSSYRGAGVVVVLGHLGRPREDDDGRVFQLLFEEAAEVWAVSILGVEETAQHRGRTVPDDEALGATCGTAAPGASSSEPSELVASTISSPG